MATNIALWINTALWDAVCKTDPAHTKAFTKGGGFKGTAIKPYWLMRRATETFGVCGIGWGWEEIENKMVAGVWCSKVRLWFMQNNQRGQIEQWGQTVMEDQREIKIDGKGTGNYKPYVDEEAPKKAVTDGVTKCLSYLGFAGDVHMGLFDDSKYVGEMKQEFAEYKGVFDTHESLNTFVANCIKALGEAQSGAAVKDQKELNLARWIAMRDSQNPVDKAGYEKVIGVYNQAITAFKEKAKDTKPQTVEHAKQPSPLGNDTIPF